MFRYYFTEWLEADRRIPGVETHRWRNVASSMSAAGDKGPGWYQPSSVRAVRNALSVLGVAHSLFTFCDLGSGKGRVVFEAAAYPFQRIIGIELDPVCHAIAKSNLARLRDHDYARYGRIELVNDNARLFPMPPGNVVIFLFNPFDSQTLTDVLVGLMTPPERPRHIVLMVQQPSREMLDVIDAFGYTLTACLRGDHSYLYETRLSVASVDA